MQAIILAGGFGTRLQLVIKDVPKPMADIDGKPFLEYLILYLKKFGFTDICISVGYLQEKIISYFGNQYNGINISYACEDEPLGTGGAIINSFENCDQSKPIFILNGDSFLQIDYKKLADFHNENQSSLTIVLREMADCSRYGAVEIDEKNHITNFKEKDPNLRSGLINGGIYVVDSKIFSTLPLEKKFSFEQDFLIPLISQKQDKKILGFVANNYFVDIGIPTDYQKAKEELPKITKNKALFLDRDGVINIDYEYVHKKENFHFIEGIFDLCKKAQDLGYIIIIVTNQAGIAKGHYSLEQFLSLMQWVEQEFLNHGIQIAKTYFCPYHIEGKIEKYRLDSFDRKPKPGMLLKAIEEFNIDPSKSVMIGDRISDMEAAESAKIAKKFLFKMKDKLPKNEIVYKMIDDLAEIEF